MIYWKSAIVPVLLVFFLLQQRCQILLVLRYITVTFILWLTDLSIATHSCHTAECMHTVPKLFLSGSDAPSEWKVTRSWSEPKSCWACCIKNKGPGITEWIHYFNGWSLKTWVAPMEWTAKWREAGMSKQTLKNTRKAWILSHKQAKWR